MSDSAEHKFISAATDDALRSFSATKFLGATEAQRRTFDYACILQRDFSRPLVSQVLWSHQEGIEKDLRTLLFDGEASLKLYFVRDNVKNRARVFELIKSYRDAATVRNLLRGLRIVPVPEGFDADSEKQQKFMRNYLLNEISRDLMFGTVFGKLTKSDIRTFSNHGGPLGLKYAALHWIDREGINHGPTFEKKVGTKGSPLREALAMLRGVGYTVFPMNSIETAPSLKGRFLLDLSRKLAYEWSAQKIWSEELKLVTNHLGLDLPKHGDDLESTSYENNIAAELIDSIHSAKQQFGVDLLDGINREDPQFYSSFDWKRFEFHQTNRTLWEIDDDLPLPSE